MGAGWEGLGLNADGITHAACGKIFAVILQRWLTLCSCVCVSAVFCKKKKQQQKPKQQQNNTVTIVFVGSKCTDL
jgi:hypothetical protein